MTETPSTTDRDVKAKLRKMWALGHYAAVATEIIPSLGPILVEACRVSSRDHVLDVAAGTGNAAVPAAETGAEVTASDLTPELLEVGKRLAGANGTTLQWIVADAEALPFPDASFDVVLSCVGVMFAPHHQEAADEMLRVCRPNGRVGLINWTPEGFIGRMFSTMKPYAPPPPPGAQPPPLWGKPEHVETLFGTNVRNLRAERRMLHVDHFSSSEAFLSFFKENYGPTIAVYKYLADSPDRAAALDSDLLRIAEECRSASEGGMEWEYLLMTGERS